MSGGGMMSKDGDVKKSGNEMMGMDKVWFISTFAELTHHAVCFSQSSFRIDSRLPAIGLLIHRGIFPV